MLTSSLYFDAPVSPAELKADQEALRAEWQNDKTGYYALPDSQEALLDALESYQLRVQGYESIAVIGIGGSSLGAKAAERMLRHLPHRNEKKLLFLENGDPIELTAALKSINPQKTLFFVISKSGGTIETTSIFKLVLSCLGKCVVDKSCADQVAVITDEGSPLDKLGADYGFTRFHLPKSVGGRFSVLSAVGLVPLKLAGYDISALLEGARITRDEFFTGDPLHLSAKARFYARTSGTQPINALFAYANAFEEFTKWYVQLWGESLGKLDADKKRVGLTPIGLIGSVDQHSFLQLIMEGPADKSVTFIKVKDFDNTLNIPKITLPGLEKNDFVNGCTFEKLINAQADATLEALKSQKVPCDELVVDRLDEWHLGALFMAYELLTSLAGHALKVNTYDQPGVELGKTILVKNFK